MSLGVIDRLTAQKRQPCGCLLMLVLERFRYHEHPVVLPHVSHFMHVPLRTSVKFMHSPHISPS